MLHPDVIQTIARDRQARLVEAAAASRRTPQRTHLSSALQDWAHWWFAGRTQARPVTPPVVARDSCLTSPG